MISPEKWKLLTRRAKVAELVKILFTYYDTDHTEYKKIRAQIDALEAEIKKSEGPAPR
jgi:hypothetical protein